jgi:hypothetical protein
MADENDSLSLNLGGDASGFVSASKDGTAAVDGLVTSSKNLDAAFKRVAQSIDPLFSAQAKYNQELTENFELWRQGILSAQQLAQANEMSATALEKATAAVQANSAAAQAAAAEKIAAANAEKAQIIAAATETAQTQAALAIASATAAKAAAADAAQAQIEGNAAVAAAAKTLAAEKANAAVEAANASKAAANDAVATDKSAAAESVAASKEAAAAAQQAGIAKREAASSSLKASNDAADAARKQAAAERELDNAVIQLRGAIDPAYASQARYNSTMQAATALLMQNKLQTGEWTQIQKLAQAQADINTRGLGRMNQAYINLGYQAQDVTASLASGINPLVILAQQGGQTAAAMSNYGGVVGEVASFMAGPWGAAILGAALVLGMLIPKLFDVRDALEEAKAAENDFKTAVDSTTGSINAQTTALQLRALAKNADQAAGDLQKKVDKGGATARNMAQAATQGQYVSTGMGTGYNVPAQITDPTTAAKIEKLNSLFAAGTIGLNQFTGAINNMAKTNPQVRQLNDDLLKTLSERSKGKEDSYIDLDTTLRKTQAIAAQVAGKPLTDLQKKLIGVKTDAEQLGDGYYQAMAKLSVATDPVEIAEAKLQMTTAKATMELKKSEAAGVDLATANAAYTKSVGPMVKAVDDARAAKQAAAKADAEARKEAREAAAEAKKEAQDAINSAVAEDTYQIQNNQQSFAIQVEWQNKKIASLTAFYGEQSKQVIDAQRELEKMQQKHDQILLEIDQAHYQATLKDQQNHAESLKNQQETGVDIAQTSVDQQKTEGTISPLQAIAATQKLAEMKLQIEADTQDTIYHLQLESLNKQLEAYKAFGDQYAKQAAAIEDQIQVLTLGHDDAIAEREATLAKTRAGYQVELWNNIRGVTAIGADSITNSMNTAFQDIWTHQHKFGSDMISLADNLVYSYVEAGFKMLSNWLATETAKTAASLLHINLRKAANAGAVASDTALGATKVATHAGNEAAMTAASAASDAAQTTTKAAATTTQTAVGAAGATAELGQRAATSAAGAYSSTVVIPFIGPVAAPVAAALALAAVMGFATLISAKGGMGEVPGDQLAMVHKKEMILPAWIAQPLRDSLRGASVPGSANLIGGAAMSGADARAATHGNGGGSATFNYQPNHTNMGAGFDELLRKDGGTLRKWFKTQVRNGALAGVTKK